MSVMLYKLWMMFQRGRKLIGYIGLLGCLLFAYVLMQDSIPDKIYVEQGQKPDYAFGVPFTEYEVEASAQVFATRQQSAEGLIHMTEGDGGSLNRYKVVCRLFGAIPVKQIDVQEVEALHLLPAGTNIGIYVRSAHIMIIGTGEVANADGGSLEPAKNVVRSGDYILEVNGKPVATKEELVKTISFCEGKKVRLLLERDGHKLEVSIDPVYSQEGIYQLGIWVRNDIAGVGTLTYVTEDMKYGALGHGVTDADVGCLIDMEEGSIYETTIVGIRRGKKGKPGEMSGMINYDEKYRLGNVSDNTPVGIYGEMDKLPEEIGQMSQLDVAFKEEIRKGPAQIISSVEGKRQIYEIEIEQTDYHSEGNNKGIQFRVTDKALLRDTGGIIQGMSGSPIIQNGHIIGAVTHVFISDSTQGYGIFIENMLEH